MNLLLIVVMSVFTMAYESSIILTVDFNNDSNCHGMVLVKRGLGWLISISGQRNEFE